MLGFVGVCIITWLRPRPTLLPVVAMLLSAWGCWFVVLGFLIRLAVGNGPLTALDAQMMALLMITGVAVVEQVWRLRRAPRPPTS